MQRLTVEPSPISPELLAFSAMEAEIGFRAVRYHLESELQFAEVNYDSRGLMALGGRISEISGIVGRTVTFVNDCSSVAGKFTAAMEQPDNPQELSVDELFLLGEGLYSLGVRALLHARKAINGSRPVGLPRGGLRRAAVVDVVLQNAKSASDLFAQLSPIGQTKDAYDRFGWPTWEELPELELKRY